LGRFAAGLPARLLRSYGENCDYSGDRARFLGGIKVRVDTEIGGADQRAGVLLGLRGLRRAAMCCSLSEQDEGKGGFTITGQIGDVMKESMQAALTWVRSNAVS